MESLQINKLSAPRVHRPRSLQEAWELKSELGDKAVYVSGGTLLRTQWEAGTVPFPRQMIDLRNIRGMDELAAAADYLTLGSLVTLAVCRRSGQLLETAPAVQEAARNIAAPSVRNLATLGGNIASGYGDILPALLVHDAEIAVFNGRFLAVQLVEHWLGSRWSAVEPSADILAGVRLPAAAGGQDGGGPGRISVFRKAGRREAFTASLVTVALAATVDDASRSLRDVRIAAGGGSGRPQRLKEAERLLEGAVCEDRLLAGLYQAVEEGFSTYNDPFATVAYKKKTAGNLIVSELWKALNT
ncbi:molybdopterin dehydrogenase [Paenibacillus sp. PK3_47]|uniref:FAD binding domain-containing protein n=1 Tax=Paenibacillus sp. PK3_47 TaxID=2072642 RepID=UPI00201D76A5|nr:FAD binding domain-containing protein [Paenibacillus sp. PK3_47]UQZ35370.1 molybdopterin dehydrogenase [Paenibacillus sp. PK3_47]